MKRFASIAFLLVLISACTGTQGSLPTPSASPLETPLASPSRPPASRLPPPTSTVSSSPIPVEQVSFATTDGISLAGELFGEGDTAVILAHQGTYGANQTTWYPFARLLAEHGMAALAFDFRGVGKSGGPLLYSNLGLDVAAAVEFLEGRGYSKIACVGASMGGTACIQVAQDYPFIGLVILSSTMTAGPGADCLCLGPEYLEALTQPKLFISAKADVSIVVWDTKRMFDLSPEPKSLLMLPGTQHGTDLFKTDAGAELRSTMYDFLQSLGDPVSELPPDQGEPAFSPGRPG